MHLNECCPLGYLAMEGFGRIAALFVT